MKILYLMHVDWNWIKQRPHFIAEYLAKNGYEVDVYYKPYSKKFYVENNTELVSLKPIKQIKGQRFSIIQKINFWLYKNSVKRIVKNNSYDYVYITHPSMFVKDLKSKLIYDCMDDNAAFSTSDKKRNDMIQREKELIQQSEIVLFSSDYLSQTVINRIGFSPKKYRIINNAINLSSNQIKNICSEKKGWQDSDKIILTYIGTISDWFDVELLRKVQKDYSEKKIIFKLYGPVDTKADFSGFDLMGSVKHEKIFEIMEESDVLIMPFVLNDLIKSVNPVKLYEYIYSGKPVIATKYGETLKFSDYVYLYNSNDCESFISCLNDIQNNQLRSKRSFEEAQEFVRNNTWENRVCQIIDML